LQPPGVITQNNKTGIVSPEFPHVDAKTGIVPGILPLGDEDFERRLEKKLGRVPRRQKPGPKKVETN